jgi:hypothetical protein
MSDGPFADWDETKPVGNEHIDSIGRDLLGTYDDNESVDAKSDGTDYSLMDEQRRVAAMNIAQHVAHDDVRKLISDAALVAEYLKTGELPTGDPA